MDDENSKWLSSYYEKHPNFIIVEDSSLVSDDLLEISDVVLIYFSTVGISALERLPVISICQNRPSVPIPEEYKNIKTKKSYIEAIKCAIGNENNDVDLQEYKKLASCYGSMFHGRSVAFFDHSGYSKKIAALGIDPNEKETQKPRSAHS